MSIASLSSTSTAASTTKKSRRFSLVRLFSNSSNNLNDNNTSNGPYRRSLEPTCSMDTMQTDIMRERRKSIAALTGSPRCSMSSFDFRPSSSSSGRRPILGGRKESAQQSAEMTEKMRQFDEMLYTRKTTIRISLTPTLLQEPFQSKPKPKPKPS
ncbi:hypothetical protein BGX24_004191 [Mortierella sp. AD032]|nr:hypothetical protein BGX24_004191 [Mortierella sp. AD032]